MTRDAVCGPPLRRLDLAVDLVLHGRRPGDVVEVLLAPLAAGLDDEVAGADDPLEDRLVEADVVHPLEWDLLAVLGDDAGAVDEAVGGDDEVRRPPPEVANGEPHHRD